MLFYCDKINIFNNTSYILKLPKRKVNNFYNRQDVKIKGSLSYRLFLQQRIVQQEVLVSGQFKV